MHKPYQLPLPELGDGVQAIKVMHVAGLLPSVKAAMQRALNAVTPPLSRDDKSRTLSVATLEKWLSTSDLDHFPTLPALEIFMIAVGSRTPLDVLASIHGYRLISPEDVKILEYGKARLASKGKGDRPCLNVCPLKFQASPQWMRQLLPLKRP